MWRYAQKFVRSVDSALTYVGTTLANLSSNFITIDKVKIAMTVTYAWAWAGLYVTKAFEALFMGVLNMPDKWLAFPIGDAVNSSGQKIKILSAKSGQSDITNKLKLFMKLYWEKGNIYSANDTNGFDFAKLAKLLNISMMYCCYLLTDAKGDIQPEQFWNSVHMFLVEQASNGDCYRSNKRDLSDRSKLWLRNVDFEGDKPIKPDEDSLDDMDDELSAYIKQGTTLEPGKMRVIELH